MRLTRVIDGAGVVWFLALDTVRLRRALHGQAFATALVCIRQAAERTGTAVLDTCVIAHGLRALVRISSKSALRRFERRLVTLLALAPGPSDVRWRPRADVALVSPDRVRSFREYFARCRSIAGEHTAVKRARQNGKPALRRAAQYLQAIERANEATLGGDEVASRARRYAAAHEAPHDDRSAFAKLCAVIFAQGLGFEVVDKHWTALESAFENFTPRAVAAIDEERIGRMLAEPVIRNRAKIVACIENARRWLELASDATYLGRVAARASNDDAAAGWPALALALQNDFQRLREPTARLTLKRWGFFTAKSHPGSQRLLLRLKFIDANADGVSVQRFVGSLAQMLSRDPYEIEASLAIFAGTGPCRGQPRCNECVLNDRCESAVMV